MTNAQSSVSNPIERSRSDAELALVLETYLSDLERGNTPDPQELLAQHPRIADRLKTCLENLLFLERAVDRPIMTDPSDANLAQTALGDFVLVRQIGRGGMGVVYEARQLSLERKVAVKVLPFAAVLDERQLQRFKNEALAAASLEHPHIVNVVFVGCERGVHFYAMRYVDGKNLAQVITELQHVGSRGRGTASEHVDHPRHRASNDDPPAHSDSDNLETADTQPIAALTTEWSDDRRRYFRSVARLGIQAAEALEYAHRMGIIHRDVKPSNLLVDRHGHLWVTDFGLAQIAGNQNLTLTGAALGTLRYMSPEQANGERFVDPRTDVYSLGITLYELLALRPAFHETERSLLLKQVTDHEPAPKTQLVDPGRPGANHPQGHRQGSQRSVRHSPIAGGRP
jgi:hypothetical protein